MIRLPGHRIGNSAVGKLALLWRAGRESDHESAGGWLVLWQPGWWIPERISVFVEQLAEGRSREGGVRSQDSGFRKVAEAALLKSES
jgi:hypothetical protein